MFCSRLLLWKTDKSSLGSYIYQSAELSARWNAAEHSHPSYADLRGAGRGLHLSGADHTVQTQELRRSDCSSVYVSLWNRTLLPRIPASRSRTRPDVWWRDDRD